MDENKRDKLLQTGYRIPRSCGHCVNGFFTKSSDFGFCSVHKYDHGKHGERQLSVHRFGGCDEFEPDEKKLALIHAFVEFMGP